MKSVTLFAGGHSLGGAFALLMACMARLRFQVPPETISCYTFGAPPVMSVADKAVGKNVMQVPMTFQCMTLKATPCETSVKRAVGCALISVAFGRMPSRRKPPGVGRIGLKEFSGASAQVVDLPRGSVKSFVLDNDPIPRAMLSVDPTFALLKQSVPVSLLLEARKMLFGSRATFTPERFLYENVGEVIETLYIHATLNVLLRPVSPHVSSKFMVTTAFLVTGVLDTMDCRVWPEGKIHL